MLVLARRSRVRKSEIPDQFDLFIWAETVAETAHARATQPTPFVTFLMRSRGVSRAMAIALCNARGLESEVFQ